MEKIDVVKIYEDDSILVLNKPSGLVVNLSQTATFGTLQNYLQDNFEFSEDNVEDSVSEFVGRSGIVHRLDKDTSGVLVVAKDIDSFNNLLAQFKNREVSKKYIAVLHGGLKDELVEINAPIKRSPKDPMKFAIVTDGRDAQTSIERVKVFVRSEKKYTLVNVFPKTGRTHQIRVHCAAINHAVAGDPIYNTVKVYDDTLIDFARLMLHAHTISFIHPKTNERVEYVAEIPDEFKV